MCLKARVDIIVVSPCEEPGHRRNYACGPWRMVEGRNWQSLDDCGGDVGGDLHPHQVVDDEAVENPAEKMLTGGRKASSQTKNGMRGNAAGRQNSGDERQPIPGTGDVSVSDAGLRVAPVRQKLASVLWTDAVGSRPGGRER